MQRFNKFFVAAAGVVALIADAMVDGVFTSQETETIALAIVSAIFVFLVPNKPAQG